MIEGLTNIAVIAAHPDDEVLGFGGTMHRISSKGGAVSVLILATGLAARQTSGAADPSDLAQLREHSETPCWVCETFNSQIFLITAWIR